MIGMRDARLHLFGKSCALPDVWNQVFINAIRMTAHRNPKIDFSKWQNIRVEPDGSNKGKKQIVIAIFDFRIGKLLPIEETPSR